MYPIWTGNKEIPFTLHKKFLPGSITADFSGTAVRALRLSEVLKGFLFEKYDYAVNLRTVLCSERLSDLNMSKLQALFENFAPLTACEALMGHYFWKPSSVSLHKSQIESIYMKSQENKIKPLQSLPQRVLPFHRDAFWRSKY